MTAGKTDVSVRLSPEAAKHLDQYREAVEAKHRRPVNRRTALELAVRHANHVATEGRGIRWAPDWIDDAERPRGRPRKREAE